MRTCRILHKFREIRFQIEPLECSPGCKGSEREGWEGDRDRVSHERIAPAGDGGKKGEKRACWSRVVLFWYVPPEGGEDKCKGTLQAVLAPAHTEVLAVLLIPKATGLNLCCPNLPGSHVQIPGPCRLPSQLILVKNLIAISSLWINNSNSYGHKWFFFPKKALLDIQPPVVKQRLVPFLLISTVSFF